MINIIAISGKSGCGNTTISERIAERIGYEKINYTFRKLAEEHKISFEQILKDSRTNDKYDKELDLKQVEMARRGNSILATRLAIWLMKDEAITVYLNASFETRMRNILNREKTKSKEEVVLFNKERDEYDHARFLKLYGINNDEYSFADIIIETDNKGLEEIENEIIDKIIEIRSTKKCPTIASTG